MASDGSQPAERVPAVRAHTIGSTSLQMPRREDFEIAIVCGLPLEYDTVSLVSEEEWKDDKENNDCKTGRIGEHNVVLALLPSMGKASAASTVASIRLSYRHVRLCFLVGICGGVPRSGSKELFLGDVVVSKAIVSYDFGRQYQDGFTLKDGIESNTTKPDRHIRKQLAMFETIDGRLRLQEEIARFLEKLQAKAIQQGCGAKYSYPGAAEDRLSKPEYRHKHRISPACICSKCEKGSDIVCEDAVKSSCHDLDVRSNTSSQERGLRRSGEETSRKLKIQPSTLELLDRETE